MANQFGENSLRNSCLAFIQLSFNILQRVRSLVGRSSAYYAGDYFVAVGSLVVRASDSRPKGLGSMLDVTKYPPSAHGVRAR
ncbi:hypothetical protein TNCV_4147301 [Trichonephila clavipes]|nr:hypothetical protein TNCV_4147301 [Trichonephila clavipes]